MPRRGVKCDVARYSFWAALVLRVRPAGEPWAIPEVGFELLLRHAGHLLSSCLNQRIAGSTSNWQSEARTFSPRFFSSALGPSANTRVSSANSREFKPPFLLLILLWHSYSFHF